MLPADRKRAFRHRQPRRLHHAVFVFCAHGDEHHAIVRIRDLVVPQLRRVLRHARILPAVPIPHGGKGRFGVAPLNLFEEACFRIANPQPAGAGKDVLAAVQRAGFAALRAEIERVFEPFCEVFALVAIRRCQLPLKRILHDVLADSVVDLLRRHLPELLRRVDVDHIPAHMPFSRGSAPARRRQIAAFKAVGDKRCAGSFCEFPRRGKDRAGHAVVGAVAFRKEADVRALFDRADDVQRGRRVRRALHARNRREEIDEQPGKEPLSKHVFTGNEVHMLRKTQRKQRGIELPVVVCGDQKRAFPNVHRLRMKPVDRFENSAEYRLAEAIHAFVPLQSLFHAITALFSIALLYPRRAARRKQTALVWSFTRFTPKSPLRARRPLPAPAPCRPAALARH